MCVYVFDVVLPTTYAAVQIFQKIAAMLVQCVFRNKGVKARGDARGNTGASKCVPDIEVSKSTVALG